MAAGYDAAQVVRYLLDHNADFNLGNDVRAFVLPSFGLTPLQDNVRPLHYAARNNALGAAHELVLTPGIEVNAVNNSGWTPLHYAAQHNAPEIVSILLAHGANPSLRHNVCSAITLLCETHSACRRARLL